MPRTRTLAALLFVTALSPVRAHADGCVDTGKLSERLGACRYDDGCASAYADVTPRIMDDTYSVWACSGANGTVACYSHARTTFCTDDRP